MREFAIFSLRLTLLFCVSACGGGEGTTATGTAFAMGSGFCGVPEGRRLSSPPYDTLVSPLDEAFPLGAASGLTVLDSLVYVLDGFGPEIYVLNESLRVVGRFGREGEGPGELRKESLPIPRDLMTTTPGRVIVANANGPVHRFLGNGTFAGQLAPHRFRIRGSRIRVVGDTVFSAADLGFDFKTGERGDRRFRIRASWPGGDSLLMNLPLPDPPLRMGGQMIGPDEASYGWDLYGDCLILNDGRRNEIIVHHRGSENVDTIRFALPGDVVLGRLERDEASGKVIAMPTPSGESMSFAWPPPSVIARYDNLILDPAGSVWLLGSTDRSESGHVIIRVGPGGLLGVDTLGFFPNAFGPNGEAVGVERDEFDRHRIVKLSPRGEGKEY